MGFRRVLFRSALFLVRAMALPTVGQQKASLAHKRVIYAICGKYLGMFVDVLITFFMFAIAVVMLAGAGALLEQLAGIPKLWGSVAVTVLTVIIVCLDGKRSERRRVGKECVRTGESRWARDTL